MYTRWQSQHWPFQMGWNDIDSQFAFSRNTEESGLQTFLPHESMMHKTKMSKSFEQFLELLQSIQNSTSRCKTKDFPSEVCFSGFFSELCAAILAAAKSKRDLGVQFQEPDAFVIVDHRWAFSHGMLQQTLFCLHVISPRRKIDGHKGSLVAVRMTLVRGWQERGRGDTEVNLEVCPFLGDTYKLSAIIRGFFYQFQRMNENPQVHRLWRPSRKTNTFFLVSEIFFSTEESENAQQKPQKHQRTNWKQNWKKFQPE